MSRLSQARSIVTQTVENWIDHDAPSMGAALAFYAILSLAPVLVLGIGLAGAIFGNAAAQRQILHHVQRMIGFQGAVVVRGILQHPRAHHSGTAGLFAILVLLFGATGVFVELRSSLNLIWNVKVRGGWMSVVRDRLVSLVMLIAIGIVFLLSLVVTTTLAAAGKVLGGFPRVPGWSISTADILISIAGVALMCGLVFGLVPERKTNWREAWYGALVTSLLFATGKIVIGRYVASFGTSSFFGAAGSLIALLVWVYYSAQIFFLGAEFTWVLMQRRRASG